MKEPIWTKTFIALFFTNVSTFLVFYGLVSVLPLYAVGVLQRTDDEAGLLLSIFLLSAIIVRPFTGKILDHFGKRKMLWMSLILYLVCTVLYYFVTPFEILLGLRFFQGIWFSIITTACVSIVADIVPQARRGAGIGYFNMSANLAIVLGPFIALIILQYFSFDVLFLVLSGLMLFGSLSALVVPNHQLQGKEVKRFKITFADLFERNAIPSALLSSLIAFSYSGILSYITIYAQEKNVLDWVSMFYLALAAVMLVTRPYTGRIYDEKGAKFVVIPGLIVFALGLLILSYIGSGFGFIIAGAFIGLGYGAAVPSMQTIAVQSSDINRSSYATATFFTFFDIGVSIGSYILGIIALQLGYRSMYLTTVAVILLALMCYVLFERKDRTIQNMPGK